MGSTDISRCRNHFKSNFIFGNFLFSILYEFVFVKGSSHWEDAAFPTLSEKIPKAGNYTLSTSRKYKKFVRDK